MKSVTSTQIYQKLIQVRIIVAVDINEINDMTTTNLWT